MSKNLRLGKGSLNGLKFQIEVLNFNKTMTTIPIRGMNRLLSLLFILVVFSGCYRRVDEKSAIAPRIDSISPVYPPWSDACIQTDTVTQMGTAIHYLYSNGKFQISWGDSSYYRIYDSLYECAYDSGGSGLWDFVPKYYSETRDYLIFTNILECSGLANPAPLDYYAIVCPKNETDSIFERDLFVGCDGDYLVYGDWDNEYLHVLNVETKSRQTFLLKPAPWVSRSPTMEIQRAKVRGKVLHVTYEALDEDEAFIIVRRTFRIEI